MTLYLYRIGTEVPILTIENVQNYTADSVTAKNAEGNPIVYSPLAADCELSSKADCSETLRAAWRKSPTQLDRIEAQTAYTAMMTDTLLEG